MKEVLPILDFGVISSGWNLSRIKSLMQPAMLRTRWRRYRSWCFVDPHSCRGKELFESEADYLQALAAHHALMQAAVKTKQVVDVAACDALDHAIGDVGAMYTKK